KTIPKWPKSIGLNLTRYTREGLFKHTSRFKDKEKKEYKHAKLIQEFGEGYGSIEAQIVNISDEIAHHAHDLQDIWMAKIISEKEIQDIFDSSSTFLGKKPDKDKQIISVIIGKLINDVTAESIKKLNENYSGESGLQKDLFITFSEEGNKLKNNIESVIKVNAILGDEVNRMNSRGRYIINSLFSMFIKDPYCLPKEIKERFSSILCNKLNDTEGYEKTEVSNKEDIRVVCDYIASLTDKEAIDAFHSTLL
ncbi:MAG: hypothetical protein ACNYWM_05075, partial [Methanosarcinales archaeon]